MCLLPSSATAGTRGECFPTFPCEWEEISFFGFGGWATLRETFSSVWETDLDEEITGVGIGLSSDFGRGFNAEKVFHIIVYKKKTQKIVQQN